MSRHPLRTAALVAGPVALTLVLTACGSSQTDTPSTPDTPQVSVVASTDAWGSVARAVGGNLVQVESIIDSPGVDPHGYEATPADATTVGDAQLIVRNGGGYDAFMTDLVGASTGNAPVIDAVEVSGGGGGHEHGPAEQGSAEQGSGEHEHEHEGAAGHEHEHGAVNEHVWYDLTAVQQVADAVAQQLTTIDPAHADYYDTNVEALRGGLQQLTSKATDIGGTHPGARVAVTEPVPEHLLHTVGVQNVTPPEFTSAVEEGSDPPAAVVARTLDLFRAQPPVDALVVNSQTGSASTDQVRTAAEEAGVPVVEMSETLPDGVDDYVLWMNTNLDQLRAALDR